MGSACKAASAAFCLDYFYPEGISIIEWAENGGYYIPEDIIEIEIKKSFDEIYPFQKPLELNNSFLKYFIRSIGIIQLFLCIIQRYYKVH